METIDISQTEEIFTVTRLNREARLILEGSFPLLWVEGEISNFAAPTSGHWYFSLKDATAQVRCAMFKLQNRKLNFTPRDGLHVVIKARISLYEGRGEFQLLAEFMEETGEGKLRQAFEALKKRLFAAGLFDPTRKKALPSMPQSIGIITSSTGAAIRDILSILKRRFPQAAVTIYPTLVQGSSAAPAIVTAIRTANRRQECDVLIITRGGGSLEDLWPFNEEIVANAIYNSLIPTISGVGHEIDFTIADFVADQRAPTPSAAAELVSPDRLELLQSIQHCQQRLIQNLQQKLRQFQQNIGWLNKHLQQQHPKRRLAEQSQHLDLCETTLKHLQSQFFAQQQNNLQKIQARLLSLTPLHRIRELNNRLGMQQQRLQHAMEICLQSQQQQLARAASTLEGISPLATLKRGYSITTNRSNQQVLQRVEEVHAGDKVQIRLLNGHVDCTVDQTSQNNINGDED
jgi:exodeoxyribonuclease VII large subunit